MNAGARRREPASCGSSARPSWTCHTAKATHRRHFWSLTSESSSLRCPSSRNTSHYPMPSVALEHRAGVRGTPEPRARPRQLPTSGYALRGGGLAKRCADTVRPPRPGTARVGFCSPTGNAPSVPIESIYEGCRNAGTSMGAPCSGRGVRSRVLCYQRQRHTLHNVAVGAETPPHARLPEDCRESLVDHPPGRHRRAGGRLPLERLCPPSVYLATPR